MSVYNSGDFIINRTDREELVDTDEKIILVRDFDCQNTNWSDVFTNNNEKNYKTSARD